MEYLPDPGSRNYSMELGAPKLPRAVKCKHLHDWLRNLLGMGVVIFWETERHERHWDRTWKEALAK